MKTKNDLQTYGERGYYAKENAPVYFTPDMEKTCAWFRDVLGWYGDIVGRNGNGGAEYGCVFDYPGELIVLGLTPFRGIHLFRGEATKGVAGFIMVQGPRNCGISSSKTAGRKSQRSNRRCGAHGNAASPPSTAVFAIL